MTDSTATWCSPTSDLTSIHFFIEAVSEISDAPGVSVQVDDLSGYAEFTGLTVSERADVWALWLLGHPA